MPTSLAMAAALFSTLSQISNSKKSSAYGHNRTYFYGFFFSLALQNPPYNSFDDFLEKELNNVKLFLSNGGLNKLESGNVTFYESILQGEWGRLMKGLYAFHLRRWLSIFPENDILIVDGDLMTNKPWLIMQEIQQFLNIPEVLTKESFVTNPETGFYCLDEKPVMRCLGSNKGQTRRRTEDGGITSKMSERSKSILKEFYKLYDIELLKLTRKNFTWMNEMT